MDNTPYNRKSILYGRLRYIPSSHPQQESAENQHDKSKTWEEIHSNKNLTINRWGLGISLVTLLVAALVFKETFTQTKQAIRAADAATLSSETAKDAITESQKMFEYQLKKDSIDSLSQSGQLALNEKSVNAQINNLKEVHKQFILGNEPYLQLSAAVIDTFALDKYPTIHFQLENLGNYPVKIINVKDIIVTRVSNPGLSAIKTGEGAGSLLNSYIVRGGDQIFQVSLEYPINFNRFNMVMKGTWYLWYGGILTYQNLITRQLKTYHFMVKMSPNKIGQLLINDNY